jgi:hypothetical protein
MQQQKKSPGFITGPLQGLCFGHMRCHRVLVGKGNINKRMRAALQLTACLTDITYIQNCLSVKKVSVHMFLE